VEARWLVVALAYELNVLNCDIADCLEVSKTSIPTMVKRAREQRKNDADFRQRLETLRQRFRLSKPQVEKSASLGWKFTDEELLMEIRAKEEAEKFFERYGQGYKATTSYGRIFNDRKKYL
jgi:hypothetical protein